MLEKAHHNMLQQYGFLPLKKGHLLILDNTKPTMTTTQKEYLYSIILQTY